MINYYGVIIAFLSIAVFMSCSEDLEPTDRHLAAMKSSSSEEASSSSVEAYDEPSSSSAEAYYEPYSSSSELVLSSSSSEDAYNRLLRKIILRPSLSYTERRSY